MREKAQNGILMIALKGCKTVHVRTFLLMFFVTVVSAAPRCYSSEHDSSVMCDDDEAVCFTVCNKNITIQGCSWGSCDALISMFPYISDCKNCKEDNCNIEACVDGKIGIYRPEKSDTKYIRVKNLTRYRLVWPDPRDSKKSSPSTLSQPKIRYYTHNRLHSNQIKTSTNKLITTSTASTTEEKPPDLSNTDSGGSSAKSGEAEAPAKGEDRQGGSGSVNGLEKILILLLLLTLLLLCLLSTCWIFLYKRFCTCNHTGLLNVSDECLVSSEDQCNLGCVKDYPCKDFDRIHIRMDNVESSCLTGDTEKNGKGYRPSSCTCKRKPKVPQSKNPSDKNREYASESRPNSKSYRRRERTTNGIRKKKPESLELTGQTDDTSFNNTGQEEARSIKIGKGICKHSDVERVCKEINKILNSWDLTEKSCSNSSHKKIQIKNIQTVRNKETVKKNKESTPTDGKRKHSIKARIKIYKEKNENIESFDQTDVPVNNTCKERIQSEDKEKIDDPYTKKLQSNKKNGYHLRYGKLTQNKVDYRKNCIIIARVDNSSPENTKTLIDCSEKINSVSNDSCSIVTSNARSDSIPSESCPSTRTNNSDMAVIPCHHVSSDAPQIWPNLSVVSSVRYLLVPGYYIQGLSVTALQMIMSKYQGGSYQNPQSQNYQNQQGTSYQNPQGPIYQNPHGPSYQNPQGPNYQNPQGPIYQNPHGPSYQHGQGIYLVPGTRMDPSPLGSTWNKDARTHRNFVKDGKKLEVRYKHEFC